MGLTVLGKPEEGESCEADVVFVHGLNGDPIKAWTHPKSRVCWPKDWLVEDLPNIRVMSYAYNADVAFGNTTADVLDHAKGLLSSLLDEREQPDESNRPLIFVGHSLGGIVIKQALFHGRVDPRYKSTYESATGIIFFGTPHRGSKTASYGEVLDRVAHTMLRKPTSKLLKALRRNSDELNELSSNFQYQLPRLEIVSFYETRPMKVGSSLTAERESSLLCVPNEESIPVDADHSQICKFEDREDETYQKCIRRIRKMSKAHEDVRDLLIRTKSINQHYFIPRDVNSCFTGRKELIKRLEHALLSASDIQQRRYVIIGLGGMGKSEVCLRFAAMHRQRFWGVFWVDCSTPSIAEHTFVDLAKKCGATMDNFDDAKSWLTHVEQPWLLILDNADDPETDYARYFPVSHNGVIILTTRVPDCSIHSTVGYENIDDLGLLDAKELLLKAAGIAKQDWLSHLEVAEEVIKVLGSHTLAIVQAGAVIRNRFCFLDDYTKLFGQRRDWLLQYRSGQAKSQYGDVYATFEVSAQMLESSTLQEHGDALELLGILAFVHSEAIPVALFERAFTLSRSPDQHQSHPDIKYDFQGLTDWHLACLPSFLQRGSSCLKQSPSTWQAFQVLASSSLLSVSRNVYGTFLSMHPLTHAWAKDRLRESQQQRAQDMTGSILAFSIDVNDVHVPAYRRIRTHAQTFVHHLQDLQELSPQYKKIFFRVAYLFRINSDYEVALRLYQKVLSHTAQGPPEGGIRDVKLQILFCKVELAQFTNVIYELEEIVRYDAKTWGASHRDCLISQYDLARAYTGIGRHTEAIELLKDVNKTWMTRFYATDPICLDIQYTLARAYYGVCQFQEAAELMEAVVGIRRRKLDATHPYRLLSQYELARSYVEIGKCEEAIEILEENLNIRNTTLDATHSSRLTTQLMLAHAYIRVCRYEEATELLEEVVSIQKLTLDATHLTRLVSQQHLARAYEESGRYEEAIELLEEIAKVQNATLDVLDYNSLTCQYELANAYYETGRYSEALHLATQVAGIEASLEDGRPEESTTDLLCKIEEAIADDSSRAMTKTPQASFEASEAALKPMPHRSRKSFWKARRKEPAKKDR